MSSIATLAMGYIRNGQPMDVMQKQRALTTPAEVAMATSAASFFQLWSENGRIEWDIPKFSVFGLFKVKITVWIALVIT